MRQAGVLAAAGMVAINDFERGMLSSDHLRARMIAEAISKMPGFSVDVNTVHSNIVLVEMTPDHTSTPAEVTGFLVEKGVVVLPFGPNNIRLVTHRDISDENVDDVVAAFRDVSARLVPRSTTTTSSSAESSSAYTRVKRKAGLLLSPAVTSLIPSGIRSIMEAATGNISNSL
jgi:threonine aldolase